MIYNGGFVDMYKAMIVSVGGSPAPVIKTLDEFEPEFVCFVVSGGKDGSKKDVNPTIGEGFVAVSGSGDDGDIIIKSFPNFKYCVVEISNHQNLVECYGKSVSAIGFVESQGYDKSSCIIDYTGGTKSMTAGLVLAGAKAGYSFSYVGGTKRDKKNLGVVLDGFEDICRYKNPLEMYADEEFKLACMFFNSGHPVGALNIIKEALSKVSDVAERYRRMTLVKNIINCYVYWDVFDHEHAMNLMQVCLKNLKQLDDAGFASVYERMKVNIKLLPKLDGPDKQKYLIVDLLQNARRRGVEGKYDDGVARLYRTIEMLAQFRLMDVHGIDSSDVDIEKLRQCVESRFWDDVSGMRNEHNDKIQIGLHADYQVLCKLGDEVGQSFMDNPEMGRILDMRNKSILAHGNVPIGKGDFEQLYQLTRKFVGLVFEDLDILENQCRFAELHLDSV